MKKLIILSLVLLTGLSGCRKAKFDKFPNIIRVQTNLPFGSIVNMLVATQEKMDEFRKVSSMLTPDGLLKNIEEITNEYGVGTMIGWVDNEDGIVEFNIDWYKDMPGVGSPHNNELTFIPYYFLDTEPHNDADFADYYADSWIYFGQKLGEVTAKLDPKVIYDWDPSTSNLIDSGERTEKIDRSESSSSSNNSQAGNCDLNNYSGPNFDIQIDSQCKTAYAYDCSGNQDGVAAACAIYNQYREQDPTIPVCPYCP